MSYEFNLRNLFQDFNPSKFVVYVCFLIFCILFSLRLEGVIQCNYYVVFIPLWVWKLTVIMGCSVGCYIWLTKPHYRTERNSHIQFRAMIISSSLQMLLLMFELLLVDKLNNDRTQVLWLFVFIPLFSISIASTGLCVWSIRNGRSFELELLCSVNILQFVFLALKLDGFIEWKWVVIFIPAWLVLCISLICLMYAIILSLILIRSNELSGDLKRRNVITALGYTCVFLPLLVFIILLSNKLDDSMSLHYPLIFSPLFISIVVCILLTFNSRASNYWWFGARRDFCTFLLDLFPALQMYANTSYKIPEKHKNNNNNDNNNNNNNNSNNNNNNTTTVSHINAVNNIDDVTFTSHNKKGKKQGRSLHKVCVQGAPKLPRVLDLPD